MSIFRYSNNNHWYDRKEGELKIWVLPLEVLLGAVLLAICLTFASCSVDYSMRKAVSAPYALAKNAPNAALTLAYLDQLDAGLVAKNATTGSTALIFKTDANSLSVYRHNLTELRDRARYVSTIDQSNISYQYAVSNLKAAVQHIGDPANGILWVNYWWLTLLTIAAWLGTVVVIFWLFVKLTA